MALKLSSVGSLQERNCACVVWGTIGLFTSKRTYIRGNEEVNFIHVCMQTAGTYSTARMQTAGTYSTARMQTAGTCSTARMQTAGIHTVQHGCGTVPVNLLT